jgi:hypothetical protein
MGQKWFAATLIMKSSIENDLEEQMLCFEQIHLILAENARLAYEKSLLGKSKEHSYSNSEGNMVYWTFAGLADLEEILEETIQDGTEVRDRLIVVNDPQTLVREKDRLTVFRSENFRNKTAREIISDIEKADCKIIDPGGDQRAGA